jgi:hypothetical protein
MVLRGKTPVRIFFVVPLLMLVGMPTVARSDPSQAGPAAATDRDQARWADWEAQARMTEGDYDGAIQAEQQADSDRRESDRLEILARSSRR